MSRATRLLALMQLLRRNRQPPTANRQPPTANRQPVAGAVLAEKMGVSLRSLYRDIASLQVRKRLVSAYSEIMNMQV